MRLHIFVFSFLFIISATSQFLSAQDATKADLAKKIKTDTLMVVTEQPVPRKAVPILAPVVPPDIKMSEEASIEYLQHIYSTASMWKKRSDPFREDIGVLLYNAVRPPLDTTVLSLTDYPYDSIKVPWEKYYIIDTVKISIPAITSDTTISDSTLLPSRPEMVYISAGEKTRKVKLSHELLPLTKNDTIAINDSVYILMREFIPKALPRLNHDTTLLVVSDTLPESSLKRDDFPFRRLKYPFMTDSIEVAIRMLLGYLEDRDSSMINFVNTENRVTDVWLNGNTDNLRRMWLYDANGDSVTVWIGSPSRNVISLQPEDGVFFKRKEMHDVYADTKINTVSAKNEVLRSVTLNKLNPNIWKYRGDISFLFSQNKFSDWASGGNSNISTTLDINGYLYYTNKVTQMSWTTAGRLALGLIKTEGVNPKKTLDVIDITSKLNHKAFGKFDFSGQMQFKTQSFPGYNYPNDSVKVSRFFNPATLIIGYGLDYKPTKTLSINFSPLSYKGIYVPDKNINQTLYGVDAGKRSKNEMGAYLTINSTEKLFKKINVTNKIQFFSSFLSKPQNIDVDWEMTMTTSLSWFADLKINTFMIYDDNTRMLVYDKDHKPVLGTDGKQLREPRIQFKELLGLSLLFRF